MRFYFYLFFHLSSTRQFFEGGLRITSGFTENRGRLEIYHKGEWGTVCDNHFDNVDAGVACKQLGYWYV